MRLNNGGVGYLADALGVVSTRDLKLRQVGARLIGAAKRSPGRAQALLRRRRLRKRRAQRLDVVDRQIFAGLNSCAQRMAFGSALRGMMVDASDLYAALSEALNRQSAPEPTGNAQPFGLRRQAPNERPPTDKWTRIANAALDRWSSMMFERSEEPAFSRRVGVELHRAQGDGGRVQRRGAPGRPRRSQSPRLSARATHRAKRSIPSPARSASWPRGASTVSSPSSISIRSTQGRNAAPLAMIFANQRSFRER